MDMMGVSPLVRCLDLGHDLIVMRLRLALLVGVVFVASCGSGGTHRLTESDSLSEVEVAVGDVVEIALEENPSTGYSWELDALPNWLELISDEYVASDSDLVGAPGTRELTFEVVSEDAGILRLEYVRAFDDPTVPERIVEFIIVAGDAVWPPVPTGSAPTTSTASSP